MVEDGPTCVSAVAIVMHGISAHPHVEESSPVGERAREEMVLLLDGAKRK